MTGLPDGWDEGTLEELAGSGGVVTDGDWVESKDQDPDGNVRLIQLMDLGDGVFRNRSQRFLTEDTAARLRCTLLAPGDVLIARMPDPIGRACVFPGVGQPAATAVDVLIWHPGRASADARWLVSAINSPDVRREIEDSAGGTTRQRVAGGSLKKIRLPVPPVAEQHRIVAKIDHLMGRSKRVRDDLNATKTLIDRYRDALLSRYFDGGLTDSIIKNRSRVSVSGYLAEKIRNGLSIAGSDVPPGVPALRLSAIRSDTVDMSDVRYLAIGLDRASKYFLEPGDILVSRGNGALRLVGKAAVVPNDCENVIFPDTAFRLRPDPSVVDARWLLWMWNAPQMRSQIEATARTTAGIWKISQADITSFELPDVPISEQREIVRSIERAFAALDCLAAEAHSAGESLKKLDQAILAKAFRGELVPQDPNDESASVLLECIRAERAAASPARKRGRRPRGTLA